MVIFCLFLAISPLGKVRIGGKDAKPDYTYAGWIAMLFSAGIGIGLLFFSVLEPMYYSLPELNTLPLGADPSVPANENMGNEGTILHWGLICRYVNLEVPL
jgi:BCCT family betaine/carnitine transporter